MKNKIVKKEMKPLTEEQLINEQRTWTASDWVDYYLQNDNTIDAETFWKEDDAEFERLLNDKEVNL